MVLCVVGKDLVFHGSNIMHNGGESKEGETMGWLEFCCLENKWSECCMCSLPGTSVTFIMYISPWDKVSAVLCGHSTKSKTFTLES